MNTNNLVVRAILIDDEQPVRRTIRSMLSTVPEIEIIAEAANVTEGIDAILELNPDLIFLDINMPIRSGFDLLDDLTIKGKFYGVIFVSGYPDEALTAMQKAAAHLHSDFVVKPVNPFMLKEKVQLFYQKWKADKLQEIEMMRQLEQAVSQAESGAFSGPKFLIFQNSSFMHRIEVADIMYCESANKQLNVYCSKQEHLNVPNTTLDVLERMLPSTHFVRIGKSHIINRDCLSYLEKSGRPRCRLVKNNTVREVLLYASNVEKVEKSYVN